jgi:hypothetical protein
VRGRGKGRQVISKKSAKEIKAGISGNKIDDTWLSASRVYTTSGMLPSHLFPSMADELESLVH